MTYSPPLKICFVGFEPRDQYVLKKLKQSIIESANTYDELKGFSYDEYVSEPNVIHDVKTALDQKNLNVNTNDDLFNFLLEQKINSLESKLVLKKIRKITDFFTAELERINPDLVIIPEDFRVLHGGLAAYLAKKLQLPFLVISPLYYELISSRPIMGSSPDTPKVHSTSFYAKRYGGHCFKRRTWPTCFSKDLSVPKTAPRTMLATLQNNGADASFLWLLARSASNKHPMSVKFHPDTPSYKREGWRATYKNPYLSFLGDEPIESLLPGKKALATASSSTLFQALLCDVPVLLMQTGPFPLASADFVNYYGCFPVVRTPDELTRQLDELDDKQKVEEILEKQKVLKDECFSNTTPEITINDLLKFIGHAPNQNSSTV